jgi:hypothetical protein
MGAGVNDGSPEAMASASWGNQLDAISPLLEDSSNDLMTRLLGILSGDNDCTGFSDSLLSESSEEDEDSFIPSGQATKPPAGHAGVWICRTCVNSLQINW